MKNKHSTLNNSVNPSPNDKPVLNAVLTVLSIATLFCLTAFFMLRKEQT